MSLMNGNSCEPAEHEFVLSNQAWNEPSQMIPLESSLDDSNNTAGYLADSEAASKPFPRLAYRKRSTTGGYVSAKAHHKKRQRLGVRRFHCSGGKRRSTKKGCDCSWIKRIFSDTPFKSPTYSRIDFFEDLSVFDMCSSRNLLVTPANLKWRLPTVGRNPECVAMLDGDAGRVDIVSTVKCGWQHVLRRGRSILCYFSGAIRATARISRIASPI